MLRQEIFIKPTRNWDGRDKIIEFVIHGQSSYDYAKNNTIPYFTISLQ